MKDLFVRTSECHFEELAAAALTRTQVKLLIRQLLKKFKAPLLTLGELVSNVSHLRDMIKYFVSDCNS